MYFLSKYRRGIFNRYQRSKSLPKYIIEDIRSFCAMVWLFLRNGFRHQVIIVFPHFPSKRSSIYRIAKQLGYNVTNRLTPKAAVLVYWEYLTFREEQSEVLRFTEQTGVKVINKNSLDISKKYVDKHFSEVFGYSTFIDPTVYQGTYVEKGDINATHDGRILHAPIEKEDPSKVYQILINNMTSPDLVQDLRVPIFKDHIPLVFIKYRNVKVRFENSTVQTELAAVDKIFSDEEQRKILEFCHRMQLDYGELDILRDQDSGRIYIVDVNNTPQSPPQNCSAEDHRKAVKLLAESFQKAFL